MLIKLGPQSIQILKYILHYQDRCGYPPSLTEIGKRMQFDSNNTVRYHIARMEKAGIIRRTKKQARSIQIVNMGMVLQMVNHHGNGYTVNYKGKNEMV